VGLRNIAPIVMFSMFCILLGVLLSLGDFAGGGGGGLRDFLVADRSAAPSSTFAILQAVLSERVAVFLYGLLNVKVLFFGGVALFGVLMSMFSIVRAAQLSREKTGMDSVRARSQRREKVRRIARPLIGTWLAMKSWKLGLTWKIAGTFAGVTLFVSLVVAGAGYYLIASALRIEASRRAFVIATNLSDGVASHVIGKNLLSLKALLARYALLEGVAYIVVENRERKVLAQSLEGEALASLLLPEGGELRNVRRRSLIFRGALVDEIRVPILEGQIGAVHVGRWNGAVEHEIKQAGSSLLSWFAPVLAFGVLLALALACRIQRPIRQLAQSADRMSKGDLDSPVGLESRDEIGALALALERMRASLRAAMTRLNQQDIRRRA